MYAKRILLRGLLVILMILGLLFLASCEGEEPNIPSQEIKEDKMNNLNAYLESKLKDVISSWDEEGIYAISFFVYSNEGYEYNGYSNLTEFLVSYNTESDCDGADRLSEERWNYAFWRQDEKPIIEISEDCEGLKILFDWYKENGIENIGYEDPAAAYDDKMNYIGKGPVGYIELLDEITAVAKKLQEDGFIKNKFGKAIPIIIHDLDYCKAVLEATEKANANGEAEEFFAAMRIHGIME